MPEYMHSRLHAMIELGGLLEDLAISLAKDARRRMKSKPRSRGATLRPGVDTPLWNALMTKVKPHLARRGAKSLLARELDLAPSRVTEFARGKAMPDAERALEMLLWVARQQTSKDGPATNLRIT